MKGSNMARDHLRPYFRAEWHALAGAALMTVLLALAELATPFPIKWTIDAVIDGRTGGFEVGRHEVMLLVAIGAVVVLISACDAIAQYFSDLWLQSAGERIAHALRIALYDHLQRLSLRFHSGRQKGDLVTRVTQDCNSVGDLFGQSLGPLSQSALLLAGMLVVTLFLDPIMALTLCVVMPVLARVTIPARQKIKAEARRQRVQDGEIASRANEALSAMSVVKAFGSEDLERDRVTEPSRKRMAFGIAVSKVQARYDGLVVVVTAFATAAVLVVGVFRVAAGALSPGDLVVFAMYARKASSPMRIIAREASKIARSMTRAERVAEILAIDDVLVDRKDAYSGPPATGALAVEDVAFHYDPARPVLKDVSLEIAPGEHVALIGPSGAGKSTLSALLARFYDPLGGRVTVDGRDMRDCSLAWLRSQVGVLLQDTVLFTGTVAENIAYGSDAGPEAVAEAARAAAADGFIEALPDGYETELGPLGGGLSGGQRQRLGIARTLLRNPPILILDEPTTALDPESEAHVVKGLRRLMEGRTTVIVTHSLDLARTVDRVVVVDGGGIVAQGPPDEVLADGGLFRRLDQARTRRTRRPRLPVDEALPQLPALLDPAAMAGALGRSLGREDAQLGDVRVHRVLYQPHERVTVHYRAEVDGREHDAVAHADAESDLAARPGRPAYREVARMVGPRSPAAHPVVHDADLDALISWAPFDVLLPGLYERPWHVASRLEWAGVQLGDLGSGPSTLAYRPAGTAVVRLNGHVLRAYGDRARYDRALAGAKVAAPAVPAPGLVLGLRDLRVIVHKAIDAEPAHDPIAIGPAAGALLGELHAVRAERLTVETPERTLDRARARAALAATLVPALAPRLEALVERLAATVPAPGALVTSQGNFGSDQLRVHGCDVLLVDFNDMCLAPPALDVATYAAKVAHGRPDDEAPATALDAVLEGYGDRPEALDWYLATAILTRSTHPFRRQVPDWPERIDGLVRTAMEALDR
jgi:ABC-type multidrug transport system fused ATPase/permease subunit